MSQPSKNGIRMLLSGLMLMVALVGDATADTWPSKPIKVVIPFGAGSASDVIPRIALDQLSQQLGQPIIVENRPGAGSVTGSNSVAKSDPDGYTLLVTSSAYSVVPAMYQNIPYDPVKDFIPIGTFGLLPSVLIVPTDRPYTSAGDMVAAAKAKPGSFNFATVGAGSAVYMAAEKFRTVAGYEAAHVPFKSGAEALTEIIAGRIDYYMCPIGTALPMIKDGKVKVLAISSGTRSPALPDLPTVGEAGFPGSAYTVWNGLLAPAGTPPAIVERLHKELIAALLNPSVKSKYDQSGVEPNPISPADFAAQIAREIADNTALAKTLNLKAN